MPSARFIEAIGRVPGVGRVLRWVASRFPEGSVVTIKHGEAAGFKWKRHHRNVNGYWIGQYELDIQAALKRELRAGDTFFDVGANAGFFTLVAAKLVGPSGRCVAFEPIPLNLESIQEQIELNGLQIKCKAVAAAVSDAPGQADFSFSPDHADRGQLGTEAPHATTNITVTVITLDEAMQNWGKPSFVKMDVEGAEAKALAGAAKMLADAPPNWLIEIHNDDCEKVVRQTLRDAGYAFFEVNGSPIAAGAVLPHHIIARHSSQEFGRI
jgi:FkbM family methyltransferase